MSDPKKLSIILTKGPFVSEAADMALNTALKARKKGYDVFIFLYLDGAWTSHLTEDKEFNHPGEWIRWAIKKGIEVAACSRCTGARDLKEGEIIDGIKISGSYRLMDVLKESDKVLTFGG